MRTRFLGTFATALCLSVSLQSGFAADYVQSAQAALRKGDLRTAQIQLRNAVKSDPQNAEARFLLAEVQLQLGDPVAAEEQARAAEARGYDKTKTVPVIGQALLLQNRPADLLKQFQPTGNDPKLDSEILVDRGAAQLALGNTDDARKSFDDAQKLNPSDIQSWLAGARLALARRDLPAAQAQVEKALTLDSKSLDARLLKAQLLVQSKDIAGAVVLLNQAINDTPPALPARLMRANLLIAQGKFDLAKTDDEAVLALQPQNIEAVYLKAVLLHESGNNQAASDLLTKLQPVFDRMPRAYYLQALIRQKLGLTQLAEASARDYVSHVPNDPNGIKLLAQLDIEMGRPDQAVAPLQRLLTANSDDLQAAEMLARAALASNQPAVARQALEKAIAADPKQAAFKAQLGGVLVDLGQPDAGVDQLTQALALDPKNPRYAEALFLAALKTGNPDRAASALDTIRQDQGDSVTVQNLDGLLKLSRLDLSGAQAEFESIIKADPDFVPAKINLARVLLGQGDVSGYKNILQGVLDKNPGSQPALGMMADTLVRANQQDDAIALLQKAHGAAPTDARITASLGNLFIQTGQAQKALDLIAPAKPGDPVLPEYLGLQASAQLALKQTDQAKATLNEVLTQNPRNLGARRDLVAMLVDAKDYEDARNVLQAGMAAMPNVYQLKLDYALVDLKAKGVAAAEATADELYNQDRAYPAAPALKGDVLMAAGQPAEAVKAFQAAVTTTPSQLLTMRLVGAQQAAGQTDDAEKTLSTWVSSHPDDLLALNGLASLEITQQRYAEAKLHLQALLAKTPQDAAALNNLAWVDQQLGDSTAEMLAKKAYLLAPSPQTADTLGWIMISRGDAPMGTILLRQAVAGSTDPRILYHYAVALKDSGDKAQAMKLLQNVASAQGQFQEKTDAQRLLTELTKGS